MTREEAERELCRLLEEAEADIQAGRTIPAEEVFAQLREKFAPRNIVYLTGDTHGRFERIVDFCSRREMEPENTFVILGDAGLNFYGGRRDARNNWQSSPARSFASTATMSSGQGQSLDTSCPTTTAVRCGCSPSTPISSLPSMGRCTTSAATAAW